MQGSTRTAPWTTVGSPPARWATPRVGSDLVVDLYTTGFSGRLPARTCALGLEGLCVRTPSLFAARSLRRVVLHLSEGRLALAARGVWQHELRAEGCVLTGVEFVEPGSEAVEKIWDLVLARGRALARTLAASPDLSGLGLEDAFALAQLTRLRELPAGRILYRQGEAGGDESSLFVVLEGSVVLQRRVREAREVSLARLGPGRAVGGLGLLGELAPPESAVAAAPLRAIEIDRTAFAYLQRAKPWLAHRLGGAVLRLHAERLATLLAQAADRL